MIFKVDLFYIAFLVGDIEYFSFYIAAIGIYLFTSSKVVVLFLP